MTENLWVCSAKHHRFYLFFYWFKVGQFGEAVPGESDGEINMPSDPSENQMGSNSDNEQTDPEVQGSASDGGMDNNPSDSNDEV